MRLSRRLIASLILGVTLVLVSFAVNDIGNQIEQLRARLTGRAASDALALHEALLPLLRDDAIDQAATVAESFRSRSQAAGVAIYDPHGQTISATPALSGALIDRARALVEAGDGRGHGEFLGSGDSSVLAYVQPLGQDGRPPGTLAIFLDASEIGAARTALWRNRVVSLLIQVTAIVVITLLLVQWNFLKPLARTAVWLQEFRLGRVGQSPLAEGDIFKALISEVTHLVKRLEAARAVAEEEARLREAGESLWTAERLRAHVRTRIQGSRLFVVSNREPCMHVRRGNRVEALVPASGLVTALEPVLRACDGTWIAHGSGDGDRSTVDGCDRLRVPPDQPEYTLRRVWLTPEEEEGYYYGFSNEGLWPLCHIAHTRPLFRASDWACYQAANRKFAEAVFEEMKNTSGAMVLVQDYHFALLPQLIKQARPDARVAVFWHIPWPNPEAFGICPWQNEVLDGLLGADVIGFHTQAHCNNFLETTERAFESRIDWEHFTARRHNHVTHVRPFPISVAFGEPAHGPRPSADALRADLLTAFGISGEFLGVGVDRVDYTKGILERFRGVERFFEKWTHYIGRFTFVQIGAPSRIRIKRYGDLLDEVRSEAERINMRFGASNWQPIVLLTRHHSHLEIDPYYRAADVCLVTALHDGMNLVAKEFVTARDDEDGVLILSQFAGASHQLRDALIVNPYDTEQVADAIRRSLEMNPDERRSRMRRMRSNVRDHNVYRWASDMVGDLAEIRLETPRSRPRGMADDERR
jgi:trehalose-6-phosphate synthase